MATLHMETDIARSTQSNIMNTHGQLTGMLQSMTGAVNNLQPSWLGNSATEFYATYDQWRSQMTGLLEQLNTLGARLQSEIAEWEAMSSKLS
ncbi:MAG TPA: WXG100 family type VII secretion target [Anaerolineaceae bacterium]|nr:WXG100 family type VII secretion target [Anaerolineaceae bacterium]